MPINPPGKIAGIIFLFFFAVVIAFPINADPLNGVSLRLLSPFPLTQTRLTGTNLFMTWTLPSVKKLFPMMHPLPMKTCSQMKNPIPKKTHFLMKNLIPKKNVFPKTTPSFLRHPLLSLRFPYSSMSRDPLT